MYKYNEITTVHLEISALCNAKCPMCLRNISGGKTNPQLPLKSLNIDEIKKIFPDTFIKQLKRIYLCGNYGDPMLARDTLPTLEYFRAHNQQLKLELFSNGSGRTKAWWSDLAKLGVEVHFGIDGLGETNQIYRRGTNFNLIMENATAFIQAGGIAHWDFIIFSHNEHQINESKSLSEKMGFRSFRAKKTGRFFSNQKSQVKERQEVLSESGEIEYYLYPPSDTNNINSSLQKERSIIEKFGSFDAYLDQSHISCKVQSEKSLFISAEGLVFPCCWTALQLYPWYSKPESTQIWQLIKSMPGGKNSLSATINGVEKVVEGDFFQKIIPSSWQKNNVQNGKLKVCSKICGQEFDPFRDQF